MTYGDHEEPITDIVEQSQLVVPDVEESGQPELPEQVPLEADVADTAEQAREVELDEDDYR